MEDKGRISVAIEFGETARDPRSCESVEPSESSMDVSSRCESVPVSSVSYCLMKTYQKCWRRAS